MKNTISLFYRHKFIIYYTFIGLFSLVVELITLKTFLSFELDNLYALIISWLIGLLIAFYLNITFNFHISNSKRFKALVYFTLISFISFSFQFLIRNYLIEYGFGMDISRFIISGLFFGFSYVLHRRFSFKEYKKLGIAIYADGVEDIKLIHSKISNAPDFIHLDIVDKSYNSNCEDVRAFRSEAVRAYWPTKKIEVHIMSKHPSLWIDDLIPFVDVIYIHPTIDEPLVDVLDKINSNGVKAGLALGINEDITLIDELIELKKIKNILLLSIPKPGFSGQKFDVEALNILQYLNKHKYRSKFDLCVDGGVNDKTVGLLNVESVVSGSYVLNATNPIKNIVHLQTSAEYVRY